MQDPANESVPTSTPEPKPAEGASPPRLVDLHFQFDLGGSGERISVTLDLSSLKVNDVGGTDEEPGAPLRAQITQVLGASAQSLRAILGLFVMAIHEQPEDAVKVLDRYLQGCIRYNNEVVVLSERLKKKLPLLSKIVVGSGSDPGNWFGKEKRVLPKGAARGLRIVKP